MNGLGQSARTLRRRHPSPVSGTPCVCLGVKKGRSLVSDLCSPRCTLGFKSRGVDALLDLEDGTTAEGRFPSLQEGTLLSSPWGQGAAGVSVLGQPPPASLKGNRKLLLCESVVNTVSEEPPI